LDGLYNPFSDKVYLLCVLFLKPALQHILLANIPSIEAGVTMMIMLGAQVVYILTTSLGMRLDYH